MTGGQDWANEFNSLPEELMPPKAKREQNSDWGTRLKAIIDRLDSFTELKEGWDSYGAPPPDAQAVSRAKLLVTDLFNHGYVPTVVPDSNGGVSIELTVANEYIWHTVENKP